MNFSRVGITGIIVFLSIGLLSNCTFYNRVKSRQDLVDGATAYKARKFEVARELFRDAISRDPNGESQEGRTAQVFLARTLHSEYIANRANKEKLKKLFVNIKRYYKKKLPIKAPLKPLLIFTRTSECRMNG